MKKIILSALFTIAICLTFTAMVHANLITNGSFETGAYDDSAHSGYTRLAAGSTAIDGWVVGGDGLDWHIIEGPSAHFGRNGVDGSQYAVDLSKDGGSGSYSISQTFATTVGSDYALSFLLGAPGFDTGVTVSIGGVSQDYTLAGGDQYDFDWTSIFLNFNAVDALTTLSFTNIYGGYWAPVIDNVSVESRMNPVPEPSTMLLLGLGLAGVLSLRKKIVA
jgi:hypothetical protein